MILGKAHAISVIWWNKSMISIVWRVKPRAKLIWQSKPDQDEILGKAHIDVFWARPMPI